MDKKQIIIDSRAIQHSPSRGLGVYTASLVNSILENDPASAYTLYFDPNLKIEDSYQPILQARHVFGKKQPFFIPFHSLPYYRYWLKHQLSILKYDLLHFPSQIHLPPTLPKNSIVTVHDLINLALKSTFYNNELAYYADVRYTRKQLNSAIKLIADSENTKKDIIKILGIKAEKISVVYAAIKDIFYKPNNPNSALVLSQYGISGKYALYYGGSESRKNLSRLIDAFALFAVEFTDFNLVLVLNLSDPPAMAIKKKVDLMRFGDRVKIINQVSDEDLVVILKNAYFLAMPSLYEGFGLPPIEANACNVPVASSNIAVLKEILNNDAAIFFNPLDIKNIYQSMKELIINYELRQKLIENGKRNAQRFSWKKCAQQTINIYNTSIKHAEN